MRRMPSPTPPRPACSSWVARRPSSAAPVTSPRRTPPTSSCASRSWTSACASSAGSRIGPRTEGYMQAVNVVTILEDWLRKADAPLREMHLDVQEVRKFQAENKASVSLKGNVLATIEVWGRSKTLDFCIMQSSDTDVQAHYYDVRVAKRFDGHFAEMPGPASSLPMTGDLVGA